MFTFKVTVPSWRRPLKVGTGSTNLGTLMPRRGVCGTVTEALLARLAWPPWRGGLSHPAATSRINPKQVPKHVVLLRKPDACLDGNERKVRMAFPSSFELID